MTKRQSIHSCSIPDGGLLRAYLGKEGYTDCFTTTVHGVVSHAQFVTAFYTTWVFKLERLILRWAVSKPSTDSDAARLAAGTSDSFAAWHVEARGCNQLLVADFTGGTRSWLMVAALSGEGGSYTNLYFGSAVVPRNSSSISKSSLGWRFHTLLGFHKLYSRILLRAARSRLLAQRPR